MSKTANGKAPGPDDIPAELLKQKGEAAIDELHAICTEIWESAEWPDDWTQSVFIPIHGDLRDYAEEQAGFRPGRGTRDQITNIRIIMEKARSHRHSTTTLHLFH